MGKNLKINDTIYNGVESLSIPTGDGGMATFVDEENAGAKLPELTNPASASDIASGKESIDGEGNVLIGNIQSVASDGYINYILEDTGEDYFFHSLNRVWLYYKLQKDLLLRNGSDFGLGIADDNFGDATAEDVAAGKTFTSAAGLKVTGTAAVGGLPIKSGRVDLNAAATTFTIPDVGADYNKFALYSLYWTEPFTYDDIYNGNNAIVTLTNALSVDGAVALLGSLLEVNPSVSGQIKISSISGRPHLHFTFNADGSVTLGAYLDWTEFRAGAYLWLAWAE